jgi:hypothetical protein
LEIDLNLGQSPEVVDFGDDEVVLGCDDCADEVEEVGRAALVEVLAFAVLIAIPDGFLTFPPFLLTL